MSLPTISDIETSDPNCKRCDGTGWVCENHNDRPWGEMTDAAGACSCGAGAPCPQCNALALYAASKPA